MGKLSLDFEAYRKSTQWYLRALWGHGIAVHGIVSASPADEPVSYVQDGGIHVPQKVRLDRPFINYYRAAASHAALHVLHPHRRFEQGDNNLLQRTLIGLVEDLMLERSAIDSFPGLRALWLGFHKSHDKVISAKSLILRLSRSLLDPNYVDGHLWVNKGRELLFGLDASNCAPERVEEIGLGLANDLGQMRLPLNSGRYENPIPYRDDNRCLWMKISQQASQSESMHAEQNAQAHSPSLKESRRGVRLSIAESGGSADPGYEIRDSNHAVLEYIRQSRLKPENRLHYPEWDYRTQVLKQHWCVVQESLAQDGSAQQMIMLARRHAHTLDLLKNTARKIRMEGHQWKRKLLDGEELELEAMLDAVVHLRGRRSPDPRVFMDRRRVYEKNIVISLLIDLSESTNQTLAGRDVPIYQTLKESLFLIGEALEAANITFNINGFSSNGRQQVFYQRYKSFDEAYSECRHRLSGIRGSYSTRLGAAIRHSSKEMLEVSGQRKLLMVITDGIPSDIDVFDEQYLVQDSHHAVVTARRQGIKPYCINLDPAANVIIERIFGAGRSDTLDNIARLPQLMSRFLLRYLHQS